MNREQSADRSEIYAILYEYRFHASLRYQRGEWIKDIVNVSKENNANHGITGILCFGKRDKTWGSRMVCFQYFEGLKTKVEQLERNILQDRRLSDVILIKKFILKERMFPNFQMKFMPMEAWFEEMKQRAEAHEMIENSKARALALRDLYELPEKQWCGFIKCCVDDDSS